MAGGAAVADVPGSNGVTAAEALLKRLEAEVPKAEEQVSKLAAMANMLEPAEAKGSAQEVAASLKSLSSELVKAKGLAPGANPELASGLDVFEKRLEEVTSKVGRVRSTAAEKVARAMEPFRVQVGQAILACSLEKTGKYGADGAFELADLDEDGLLSREDFVSFVQSCPGEFSREKLVALFEFLDDEQRGALSRDDFLRCATIFYKVSRPNVDLAATMGLAHGKSIRKLDINEIAELLEGPIVESNKVVRIRCRAVRDDAVGWVACCGTNGVVFCSQSKVHYQVKAPVSLTDQFLLSGAKTVRMLKEGDVLEVHIWEKEHEGLKRLRCRALRDGAVGWVTTVGNNGQVYCKIV